MKIQVVLASFGLILSLGIPSETVAGNLLLTTSDLEPLVSELPSRLDNDPISALTSRLTELKRSDSNHQERRALRQAISLILILRLSRISSSDTSAMLR